MEKSLFMQDSSRSNHGYEAMLDFQISWLLRLSAQKETKQPELHKVARNVLLKLIGMEKNSNVIINKVDVWKQWENIDLTAEIELEVNNKTERHLVVIEDKAYTLIHDNQLKRYVDSVNAYYHDKGHNSYKKHFWVISFYDKEEECFKTLQKQCKECKEANWDPLSFYDVIGWENGDFEDTESDLFNEFWLREWF